jgi:hypothetical protein
MESGCRGDHGSSDGGGDAGAGRIGSAGGCLGGSPRRPRRFRVGLMRALRDGVPTNKTLISLHQQS